ncbi:MAG: serine/threonine protein kinase [Anaerolineales bacterium]|nr:serine/threonine protein kinase [Anaerolineales bacterium]
MSGLQPGQMIGPYQIINQVGKGGMATVYKAYHATMDRYVAIKVLPHEFMHDERFLGRFQQEVRLIAKLEHAHILPVYDYGESEGIPYLVMRYLDAGTLKERIQADSLSLAEVDHHFTQLARALEYAHEQGIIHRDIKPSNALVDKSGNLFLTDFGIAKMVESSAHLTLTGAVTGTPAYMSPEQARGQQIDPRTDIYSLGIVLYEMVTGRVPFDADTPMAVILKQIEQPLPPPSVFKPGIHPAIEAVLLKALAKEPAQRFATMQEFLKAWALALAQATPSARVSPPAGKPAEAAAGQVRVGDQPAILREPRPTRKARPIRISKPVLIIGVIVLFVFVLLCLLLGGGTFLGLSQVNNGITSLAFSPVGSLLASGVATEDNVGLWDPRSGSLVRLLKGHTSRVSSVAFSPDGFTLASGSWDDTVFLWDVRNGDKLAEFMRPNNVTSLAFSPDGKMLASGSWDNIVIIWDIKSGSALHALEGHTGWVNSVAFSPIGSLLASGSDDHTIILWDTRSGEQLGILQGGSMVKSVAFSPDGTTLASGLLNNSVTLWDMQTSQWLRTLDGHTGDVRSVAFSPNGNLLASGSDDKTVILWNVSTGEKIRTFEDNLEGITSVAFSPDGKMLAAGAKDSTITLWDVQSGTRLLTLE